MSDDDVVFLDHMNLSVENGSSFQRMTAIGACNVLYEHVLAAPRACSQGGVRLNLTALLHMLGLSD